MGQILGEKVTFAKRNLSFSRLILSLSLSNFFNSGRKNSLFDVQTWYAFYTSERAGAWNAPTSWPKRPVHRYARTHHKSNHYIFRPLHHIPSKQIMSTLAFVGFFHPFVRPSLSIIIPTFYQILRHCVASVTVIFFSDQMDHLKWLFFIRRVLLNILLTYWFLFSFFRSIRIKKSQL